MTIELSQEEAIMLIAAIEDELTDCHLPNQAILNDLKSYLLSKLVSNISSNYSE